MFEILFLKIRKHKEKVIILISAFIILDILIFFQITGGRKGKNLDMYFLNVGQGDSEFVVFPSGVKMLIDGGKANSKVLYELSKILPATDRYIDIVMMSHPQTDHFGGLIDVLKQYRVGVFIWSGRDFGVPKTFNDLKLALQENGAKSLIVKRGDRIRNMESSVSILSPDRDLLKSKELNDTTVVAKVLSKNVKALFTGDIDKKIENIIANLKIGGVDVLKVSHHGSRFSSSMDFLKALKPKISVIEVGRNSYGHPTKDALLRIFGIDSSVYRTDMDGTVHIVADGEKIRVYRSVMAQ